MEKHTGFKDAQVNGVGLGSDGTNLQKDGTDKILDDVNAQFSDIKDVNIPTDLAEADNGKVIQAYYAPPASYGNEADGALVVSSAGQVINDYTDLTADVNQGSSVLTVRDSSNFSEGDEVMLHFAQNYRENSGAIGSVGAYEFARVLSIDSGTQITLTAGVSRNYLSDSDGNKSACTKTQLIRIPNYSSVSGDTPNYLTAKAWDGFSGGILSFRTTALSGSAPHSVQEKGYRSAQASGGGLVRGEGNDGWGAYNTYPSSAGSGRDGNPWGGGGGGHNGPGVAGGGGAGIPGYDYGRAAADLRTYLSFGGGGGSPDVVGSSGGAICIYAGNILSFTGSFSAYGGVSASGGSVLLLAPTDFTGTISVDRSTAGWGDGAVGYSLTDQPTEPPTKEYILGNKVASEYAGAAALNILTKAAVEEAIVALANIYGVDDSVNGINLKVVSQTSFYTVPAGKRLVISSLAVIIDSITDAADMPEIQFGIEGDTDSILAPVTLNAGMNVADAMEKWDEASLLQAVIPAGSVIQFGVTTAGTSTTHVGSVLLRGSLI